MKRYMNVLLSLVLSVALTGCNSDKKQEAKTEESSTTVEQNLTLPTCSIEQGVPTTESMFTVHVRCKDGNIPIDEATVTVDGTVKPVEYSGTTINDYIGFRHLQPDTSYKATLEVVVGGERIEKSTTVRTCKCNTAPVWTKKLYEIVLNSPNGTVLNLGSVSSDKEGDPISYQIVDRKVVYDPNIDCMDSTINFDPSTDIYIENKILKVRDMDTCGTDYVLVTIRATAQGGSSDTQVKFSLAQ